MKSFILLCLLALVPVLECAMFQAVAPVNQPYSVDLGAHASVVKRVWDDTAKKDPQTIRAGDNFWTNDKGEKFGEGSVRLYANGTLSFNKITNDDYASYTLPNEPENRKGDVAFAKSMFVIRPE